MAAEYFDTVESSIFQLMNVMNRRRQENPELVFGTSVDLDVRYGIDLLEAATEFDNGVMEIDIRLYQAKSSRSGLTNEAICKLAFEYEGRFSRATDKRYLELDPEWFLQEITTGDQGSRMANMSADQALAAISNDLSFAFLSSPPDERVKSVDRFAGYLANWRIVDGVAKELGESNPWPRPDIRLRQLDVFLAADSQTGLEIISLDQAKQYGQKITPNKGNLTAFSA